MQVPVGVLEGQRLDRLIRQGTHPITVRRAEIILQSALGASVEDLTEWTVELLQQTALVRRWVDVADRGRIGGESYGVETPRPCRIFINAHRAARMPVRNVLLLLPYSILRMRCD